MDAHTNESSDNEEQIKLPKFIRVNRFEKKDKEWIINQNYNYIDSSKIVAFHKSDKYWIIFWYGPYEINSTHDKMHYFIIDNTDYDSYFTQYSHNSPQTIFEKKYKKHKHKHHKNKE